jgi:GntR family transcriptional regulator, galactonate operon transcriptional repressor
MTVTRTGEGDAVGVGYAMRGLQGRLIEALGRDIVGGRYRPGDLLPKEVRLTEEYGVSRTSVRESMKVLAAKGLVEIRQRVGTRVRERDLWNDFDSDIVRWQAEQGDRDAVMRDLIELRQILEPSAARLAAVRADYADLRRIEQAGSAMVRQAGDAGAYAARDVEFHLAVYAASHNALLSRFGRLVADFMQLSFDLQQGAAEHDGLDLARDAEAHLQVFRDINRGDPEAAAESMLGVVLDGKAALIEALARIDEKEDRG